MNTEREPFTPFYKEPLVIIVAGIPLLAVILGFVILKLALSGQDSLVNDSYYKDGVSYTENVEVDAKAAALNIVAQLLFTEDEINIQLSGDMAELPASLQLQLIHPTMQDQDITAFMQHMGDGRYAGVNELVMPSRRHVWLQSLDQAWRVRNTQVIAENESFELKAN